MTIENVIGLVISAAVVIGSIPFLLRKKAGNCNERKLQPIKVKSKE
ncbi:hypothetical protein R1T16_14770 [Flavobacterium sp. DG1-102-2]|nr:hypothetical protein [Flavobacterium sp. DG1-102-2]MDV6169697.1 hypothetical protein [Flavobacterium sp. DG1-102-2]